MVDGLLLEAGTAYGQADDWILIKPAGSKHMYGLDFPVDSV